VRDAKGCTHVSLIKLASVKRAQTALLDRPKTPKRTPEFPPKKTLPFASPRECPLRPTRCRTDTSPAPAPRFPRDGPRVSVGGAGYRPPHRLGSGRGVVVSCSTGTGSAFAAAPPSSKAATTVVGTRTAGRSAFATAIAP
jgi:hypothetical protein